MAHWNDRLAAWDLTLGHSILGEKKSFRFGFLISALNKSQQLTLELRQ